MVHVATVRAIQRRRKIYCVWMKLAKCGRASVYIIFRSLCDPYGSKLQLVMTHLAQANLCVCVFVPHHSIWVYHLHHLEWLTIVAPHTQRVEQMREISVGQPLSMCMCGLKLQIIVNIERAVIDYWTCMWFAWLKLIQLIKRIVCFDGTCSHRHSQ